MSKLDLTLNPNWGCSDKEADDRTEPDSFEPTMQVNMKVTPDQNRQAVELIDPLFNAYE